MLVTRRALLAALSATAIARPAFAATPIKTVALNSVMIGVSDLATSTAVYEKLFGSWVRQDDTVIFRLAHKPTYIGLRQVKTGEKPGFLSWGVSVEEFDVAKLTKRLSDLGVKATVTKRGEMPEIWIKDVDGGTVQLQHVNDSYGGGKYGADLPTAAPEKPGLFRLETISHATLHVKDAGRAKAFYQSTFGMEIQARQGAIELLRIGRGPGFIAFAADGGSGPHHVCFTVAKFDTPQVMDTLAKAGFQNVEGSFMDVKPMTAFVRWRHEDTNGGGPTHPQGTAELYFADPDGTLLQLQDITYCGGSGKQGEICP